MAAQSARTLLIFSALATVLTIAVFLFLPPIQQPPDYHLFADHQPWFGLPNAANILSNVPFLWIAWLGWRETCNPILAAPEVWQLRVFFAGLAITGFGSAYYHWAPDMMGLAWDRAGMSLCFMALMSWLISRCIQPRIGERLLLPLLIIGLFSVGYWLFSELEGRGDLRLYLLVQFLPVLLLPVLLHRNPRVAEIAAYLWSLLGCYLLAKFFEMLDKPVADLLGVVGGHPIKHLLAAMGAYLVVLAVRRELEHRAG